jgi:hypothetical protein
VGFGPADESSNLSRATTCSRSQIEERIVKALWELRNLKPSSQKGYAKKIKFLNKNTNLDNPRVTKNYVLSLEKTNKYKMTLLSAYMHYCLDEDDSRKATAGKRDWTPDSDISMQVKKCETNPKLTIDKDTIMRIKEKLKTDDSEK